MGIRISNLINFMGNVDEINIMGEREFDFFARTSSIVPGKKCIFLTNKKYIREIDETVAMIITNSELSEYIDDNKYGIVITNEPRGLYFELLSYYEKTAGRRVTFEYILINNINDSLKEADELVNLIKGTLAYVNLIPYNEVMENEFKRSSNEHTRKFFDYLMKHGINTTVRKEFGSDIDAACGQLRAKEEKILWKDSKEIMFLAQILVA